MLQADNKGKHFIHQFESLLEMVQWIQATPAQWKRERSSKREGMLDWFGATYEQALKLASEGWEAGVRNIGALSATVPNGSVVTREYAMAGDFPDVPRYLAGDPFNMVKRGKQRSPKPSMTIAINVGLKSSISAQEAANYGAAMVALVDRLESRNVRVHLIGLWTAGLRQFGRDTDYAVSWTIKHLEDHLDLGSVAFGLAHAAMARRLCFAACERSPARLETAGYGAARGQVLPEHFIDLPAGALCIGGVSSAGSGPCKTMEGALAFAKAQINKAAGEDIVELEDWDA